MGHHQYDCGDKQMPQVAAVPSDGARRALRIFFRHWSIAMRASESPQSERGAAMITAIGQVRISRGSHGNNLKF
jgi:hypothetical protein